MHDITELTIPDLADLSRVALKAGQQASSMEACANSIVRYLHENLVDRRTGERACALVRFFKTQSLGDLTEELQTVARTTLRSDVTITPGMKCLTLLATAGDEPQWNSRHESRGHRVIPLPSARIVEQAPMISQLIKQLGFDVAEIVSADPDVIVDLEERATGVFYIPEANGSPYIPAQAEFVAPYGIRTVTGFGGALPSGNLFVIVLFTKTHVPKDRAEMLSVLAVSVKAAVLGFDYGKVFQPVNEPNASA
jgi:hypothetical protein